MPKIDEATKQQRLDRIHLFLCRHPLGLTEAEIAEEIGLERRSVNNYLRALEDQGKAYKDGLYWLPFNLKETRLRPFDLLPEEAVTLYLGVRLLVKQQDKRNEPAETALLKLATVLQADAGVGNEIEQAARELAQRPVQQGYQPIFRDVVRGYIYRKQIELTYRPLNWKKPFQTTFSTYLLEPSPIGFSTYLIGHSSAANALRAYKLERVEAVRLTREGYTIPPDFPGLDILRNAWSIVMGEETLSVVLRFSPAVKARVLETRWHPSQVTLDDPEKPGWLRWQVDVADTLDLLPWIRGWGADVDVLEPEPLRETIKKTVLELNKKYQIMAPISRPLYQIPYAKTNPDKPNEIHLLIYHLVDVGQVALAMWETVLTDSIRQRLATSLGLSIYDCGHFLAFLAGLHDLGKAGPGYQKKYAPDWLKKDLNAAGLVLQLAGNKANKAYEKSTPHGTVSTWALQMLLQETMTLEEPFARKIAIALGGHHGVWPPPGTTDSIDDSQHPRWDEVRRDLLWELMAVFSPPRNVLAPKSVSELNTFLTILSGLSSVADWVGSRNKEHFGFVEQSMSTRRYAKQSAENTRKALHDLGWQGWQPTGDAKPFVETFAYLHIDKARPVQKQVIEEARHLESPTMLILEAPTGIGKTEIAIYLADLWLQQSKGRGLYIAMPTTATSNQMFDRTHEFLKQRYPHDLVNLHLAHGQAPWSEKLKEIELQSVGDNPTEGVAAMSWFKPRKHTLLAPFGVGTVDQALMSILQTKHFFVRLFGLSHKVVIFDEVHAYDTYMNTLFHRLLAWLNAIGTSVIILSATLPAKTRRELVKAYTDHEMPETEAIYPALTIANAQEAPWTISLEKPDSYPLQLDWSLGREPGDILAFLQSELAQGGCAVVICNTVGRAQDVYKVLDAARQDGTLDVAEDDLILFHGQFPPIWRQDIETKVLKKFGKPDENGQSPDRPFRAIIVATQVIEQSLDLDFDIMITDLAPVDLVLQRAGRLHRHERGQRKHARRLMITNPKQDESGLPIFENDIFYGENLLLRSYLALHPPQSQVSIPDEMPNLIEAVYDQDFPLTLSNDEWAERLSNTFTEMKKEEEKTQQKAERSLVLAPNKRRLLDYEMLELEEDNPELHETFQARTRDIDLSLTLVCLQKIGDEVGIYLKDGQIETFSLEGSVSFGLSQKIMQNALSLQHKGLIINLLKQRIPASWSKDAGLRYCRFVIFDNHHICDTVPGYTLCLTQTYGLEIKKEAL